MVTHFNMAFKTAVVARSLRFTLEFSILIL